MTPLTQEQIEALDERFRKDAHRLNVMPCHEAHEQDRFDLYHVAADARREARRLEEKLTSAKNAAPSHYADESDLTFIVGDMACNIAKMGELVEAEHASREEARRLAAENEKLIQFTGATLCNFDINENIFKVAKRLGFLEWKDLPDTEMSFGNGEWILAPLGQKCLDAPKRAEGSL